jgi:AcrR family transcriptional regulator
MKEHGLPSVERQMRADARRNHARLLEAARAAFGECGVEAPMDDIAKRAAVGPGTLYRHFATRAELLAAVYRADVEALAAQADEFAQTRAPFDALDAWLRVQLDYVKNKRGLGAAVKAMLGTDAETVLFCRDTLRTALGRLLDAAKATGEIRPDVQAADVLRLVHGVGVASESAPEDADRLLSYVLDGLRAR